MQGWHRKLHQKNLFQPAKTRNFRLKQNRSLDILYHTKVAVGSLNCQAVSDLRNSRCSSSIDKFDRKLLTCDRIFSKNDKS